MDYESDEYIGSIAVIGSGCRFPNADTPHEFWLNIQNQCESIIDLKGHTGSIVDAKNYVAKSSMIDRLEYFDAAFFGFQKQEARLTNPAQRLMLKCCYEALEDAAYPTEPESLKVGVFLGGNLNNYAERCTKHLNTGSGFDPSFTEQMETLIGNDIHYLASRVAYKLSLSGPAVNVNSACSTSLVAICMAVRSLQVYECDMALAGGVRVSLPQGAGYHYTKGAIFSRTGQCRPFDKDADGTVFGNGGGVVLLKRLSEALQDSDNIQAIIRGVAVNNDGAKKVGFTAPSQAGQEEVVLQAIENACVDPESIDFVETHGTGTALGDPIEIAALTEAYRKFSNALGWCGVSSVKANVGHLEAAAGVASFIKVVEAVKNRIIPASTNYSSPNEEIDFPSTPFYVTTENREWPASTSPCRAGVSSFGIGGTNAHVIVEEGPKYFRDTATSIGQYALIVISADTKYSLLANCGKLNRQIVADLDFIGEDNKSKYSIWDVAYTLQVGRVERAYRLGFVVSSLEELADKLTSYLKQEDGFFDFRYGVIDTPFDDKGKFSISNSQEYDYNGLLNVIENWVSGKSIDWLLMYKNNTPRRISLPAYVFDEDRIWLEEDGSILDRDQNWMLTKEEWYKHDQADLGIDWVDALKRQNGKRIYIVSKNEDLSRNLQLLIEGLGEANPGNSENSLKLEIYQINLQDSATFNIGKPPNVIFFLDWSCESQDESTDSIKNTYSLIRNLMVNFWGEEIACYFISKEIDGYHDSYRNALTGLILSAMQENPNHQWKLIRNNETNDNPSNAQVILREWLASEKWDGNVVKYHDGVRYTRKLVRIEEKCKTEDALIKYRGVYLVVGANGPIALQLISKLLRENESTVIVLSRSLSLKNSIEHQIDKYGGRALYYSVDITDLEALARVYVDIKQIVSDPINGIFHLARTLDQELIINKEWHRFNACSGPKISGLVNIDEVTKDEKMDFVVVFSSMSSYGIIGSADYSYSTAFQNEFSIWRNKLVESGSRSGKSYTIAWGPWDVDQYWDEERNREYVKQGIGFINIEDAFRLINSLRAISPASFGAILTKDTEKALQAIEGMVATRRPRHDADKSLINIHELNKIADLEQRKTLLRKKIEDIDILDLQEEEIDYIYRLLGPAECVNNLEAREETKADNKDILSSDSDLNTEMVADLVRHTIAEILSVNDITLDTNLGDHGVDSLKAIQISNTLERRLELLVEAKWIIEYPTVGELLQQIYRIKKDGDSSCQ